MWSVVLGFGGAALVLATAIAIGLHRERAHRHRLRERQDGEQLGVRIEAAMQARMPRP